MQKISPATSTNQIKANPPSIQSSSEPADKTSKMPQLKDGQHQANTTTPLEKNHHQLRKNTGSPTNKTTTTLKDNLFMKMQNHVEENLESTKKKREIQ